MADLKNWSDEQLDKMRNDMDRLFDGLCFDLGLPPVGEGSFCEGDVCFTFQKDMLEVSLGIQGMECENIAVEVRERELVFSGQRESTQAGTHTLQAFTRRLKLPCAVHSDKTEILFEKGVLLIKIRVRSR